ncbi:hypothetical protein IP88_02785 [alpha proteobacterium AAP81b]|nr:hypothetical protein IP88_02785 [alpha proteobacterium AAP81b]
MILAVAHELFLDQGFEGTSMSEVAARLGGSKGTLYAYFDSKEALFEALITDNCARMSAQLFEGPEDTGLEQRLLAIARGYIRLVTSDMAVRMIQILAAEARRRPELGRMFYEAGPAVALDRLSAIVAAAIADGTLDADDPRLAAETLLSLARGKLHLKRMLGQIPEPDEATIDACARRAVAQFLRLCRPIAP